MKKTIYLFIILSIAHLTLNAQWKSTSDFGGDGRDGAASFVINDIAYVGAGIFSKDFYRYNGNTDQWTKLNDVANGASRSFSAAFGIGDKGYLVGGDAAFGQAHDEVWEYSQLNDTWIQKNNFPGGKRVGMFVLLFNNRVFVGGGSDNISNTGYGTIFNDFYEYLPATDTWVTKANLPEKLAFASGFVVDDKGYLCFGNSSNTQFSNKLYMYDLTTDTWTNKANCPGAARNSGIAFGLKGKGYAGLGQSNFSTTYSDFYEYSPATDTWKMQQDYPNNKTGWSIAFTLQSTGYGYVGTGATIALDFSKSMYYFSPLLSGLNTTSKSALNVYPNPFSNTIQLDNLAKNEVVSLADITGIVITTVNTAETNTIITKNLAKGIYFLHSIQGVTKLIKQ